MAFARALDIEEKPHKLGLVLLLLGLAPWGLFFLNKNPSLMMPLSGFTGLMTLAGLFIWAKRFSFDLIPDERMFQQTSGFWPRTQVLTGGYSDLAGTVIEKKGKKWIAGITLDLEAKPMYFFASKDEKSARHEFERFAKHLESRAYDFTNPDEVMEYDWHQLGNVHQDDTRITQNMMAVDFDNPPEGAFVEHGRKGFRIELGLRGFRKQFLALIVLGITIAIGGLFVFATTSSTAANSLMLVSVGLLGFLLGFIATVAGAAGAFGRERIMFYKEQIHSDTVFLSFPFWAKSIPVEQIEEIIVQNKKTGRNQNSEGESAELNMDLPKELLIRSDFSRIVFGRHQDRETLEWLRSAFIGSINISDRAA